MKYVDFANVDIHDEFWSYRQKVNREVSLRAIRKSYVETGRFDATKCAYRKWKLWLKPPHVFYDSDCAKFIEAWSYHLKKERDGEVEAFIDGLIDNIAKNQRQDGYYNAHFLVTRKDKVFSYRSEHELYCLGHLIEAAVAYANATGKTKLLEVCKRYVDYVEERFLFKKDTAFTCPGHPEIELALIKLYEHTREEKYLNLARYFIYVRGTEEGDKGLNKKEQYNPWCDGYYAQDFVPLKEQRTAEGHSVRACYLYSGATDVARIEGDDELLNALKVIYENIVDRRMYVTGGIGAKALTEAFDEDFVLPNDLAYTESCAAIALMMFAWRLRLLHDESRYSELIERVLYNGFLSGVSLDGTKFFYENPLEIDLNKRACSKERFPVSTRQKDFSCSCCPPNIARMISQLGSIVYTYDEESLTVEQFISSKASVTIGESNVKISLGCNIIENGTLSIEIQGLKGKTLRVRKPKWADGLTVEKECVERNGYLEFRVVTELERLTLTFRAKPRIVPADERVESNRGTAYVVYKNVVYCAEAVDNGALTDYAFKEGDGRVIEEEWSDLYHANLLKVPAVKNGTEVYLTMIPYFAFANRGESDMYVYIKYIK